MPSRRPVAAPVSGARTEPDAAPTDLVETDRELPVEEVAARLGLPVDMLIRRIEAGDVPARRVEDADGVRYRLRLADLGIGPDDDLDAAASDPAMSGLEPGVAAALVADLQDADASAAAAAMVAEGSPSLAVDDEDLPAIDVASSVEPVPAPPRAVEAHPVLAASVDPRAELAALSLDPHQLVAGLLDRWERTLEQRIYAEQRQRFEAELNARQARVKQLQLELDTARAQHAASLAERDRILAERERALSDRDREMEELRRPRRRGLFRRH